jgi:molybdopterin-guanine dinucleotide biosynthesis protein A
MTAVIVFAQGQQRRLPLLATRKQLLAVNGEPIIARTLRLVDEMMSAPPAVKFVVGWPDLERACCRGSLVTLASPGGSIAEGIYQSTALWSPNGRTHLLLGDVVYSRATLRAILEDERRVVAAGTPELSGSTGEVFALSFAAAAAPDVIEAIRDLGPAPRHNYTGGQLRRVLWSHMARTGRRDVDGARRYDPAVYLTVWDWTMDIDTPEHLREIDRLSNFARMEPTQ